MSITRVGLAETRHFAEGYEAIFGSKKAGPARKSSKTGKKAPRKKSRKK